MEKKVINILKIIFTVIIFFGILITFSNISYAAGMGDVTDIVNPSGDVEGWKPTLDDDSSKLVTKVTSITSVIRVVGIFVSVATLSGLGLKFMFASVEERAQYKQSMIPWLIGAIMVFTMTTIPTLIYDMIKSM